MQQPAIGHDGAKQPVTLREIRTYINFPDIAKFEFALPPLDQQRCVADIFLAMDETLQQSGAMAKAIGETRTAIVEHHFAPSGGATIKMQPLQTLGAVSYGITLGGYRETLPEERPYLRVANVKRDEIDLSEIKTINCTQDEAGRYELSAGDVLIVEGHASVSEIGRSAVWRFQDRGTLHQNHLIRVRCSENLLPDYLNLFINSGAGQDYFRRRAKSSSGLNTINSTVVKELPVPVIGLRLQEQLILEINRFDSSLRTEQANTKAMQNFLQAFLNTTFE